MRFKWIVMLLLPVMLSTVQAQELREMFRRVNPSVIVVHAQQRVIPKSASEPTENLETIGAGVLISEDGKVLTAAHVVQAADKVEVEFVNGDRVSARVISAAPFADVALLQLAKAPTGIPVARLADSNRAEIGDMIFTIGSPYGVKHSLTVGWLSSRQTPKNVFESLTALELFQVDMALFEGNSGGPVFDMKGEVIGLVSHALAKHDGEKGPNFAVTSNVARRLMLEEKRTWMGVEALMIEGELAASFNLPSSAGLLVQSVAEGSLGARLGLHEGKLNILIGEQSMLIGGDVITEILGQPLRPDPAVFENLQRNLDKLRVGDTLTMKVLRAGKEIELSTRVVD